MLSAYRLPNFSPNEKIIKIVRRDLIILLGRLLYGAVLIVLPLVLLALGLFYNPAWLSSPLIYPVLVLSASVYFLFIWLFIFFQFIDYYLDLWIITSERIIDIQQYGFFSRVIAEQRLYRIQDVASETHGFWATIFRYGEVYVQTAGEKQRFTFYQIPNPDDIRNTIIQLAEISKKKQYKIANPAVNANLTSVLDQNL